MKLTFRKTATADQVAEMHRHLGEAVHSLQRAGAVRGERFGSHALTCASQDKLLKIAKQLHYLALAMESDLMARTDSGAPFATLANPAAWEQWLQQRGQRDQSPTN